MTASTSHDASPEPAGTPGQGFSAGTTASHSLFLLREAPAAPGALGSATAAYLQAPFLPLRKPPPLCSSYYRVVARPEAPGRAAAKRAISEGHGRRSVILTRQEVASLLNKPFPDE